MSPIRTLRPGRWPLAVKLTVATAVMIVAVVASVTVRSVRSEEETFRAELQSQAQLLLNTLAASAADPLYNLDAATLTDMMAGLSTDRTVVSGRVYDLKGQIIADVHDLAAALRLHKDPYGLKLALSDAPLSEWRTDHLLVGQAVVAGRQRLGAVSVGLSTAPLRAKVAAVRREGLVQGLVAAVIGVVLALLISRTITEPLNALTRATERFAAGDLTQKISVRSRDELGVLADAFNAMTTQIRGMTEVLEQKILERTEELRTNEEALREAKAFLEHLIGTSPGIILVGNPADFSLTYVSPNIEQILGYAPEEILEVPGFWLEHIHPDHRERFLTEQRRVLDHKQQIFSTEFAFQRKDGTYCWISSVVRFERDENARLVRALGYALDITERKHAESALRENEERFRAVAETALDAIVSADGRGSIIYFNPGAERAFGYSAREAVGQPITILMPERFIKAHQQGFARFLQTGEPRVIGKTVELIGKKKDGSEFPVDVSLASWTAGKDTFFTAILRDVTEHTQAKEAAEQASRAKSEFLSRMSHELRTPLNAILGFAQLLEMDSLGHEQRESVQHILKGGQHLLDLINEVLDVARIETGRLVLSPEPVAVRDVVQESLELIAPLAAQRQVRITAPAQANPGHVMADRQRLKQVLLNLLSNAVKYNRQGGSVTLTCEETAQGRLRISVRDTGPGISPEKLSRLFIPFDRLGAERTGVDGTGIGLALSKGLVQLLGGEIGVESAANRGSTFWVEFPLVESPVERYERLREDIPAPTAVGAGHARTVLYIEDNLVNLELLQRILAHRPGVKLLSAMQGRLGLDLAGQHHPDLILLDMHLPDITGDEILRRLHDTHETSRIPVVVISADATPGQGDRLLALGACAYMPKPLDVKKLGTLLDEMLKERVG